MIPAPAGKVHGSLARAGKVRGQTPKVPKQDKKKKPKGRAMKRIKYNRRFVNVGESPRMLRQQKRRVQTWAASMHALGSMQTLFLPSLPPQLLASARRAPTSSKLLHCCCRVARWVDGSGALSSREPALGGAGGSVTT